MRYIAPSRIPELRLPSNEISTCVFRFSLFIGADPVSFLMLFLIAQDASSFFLVSN